MGDAAENGNGNGNGQLEVKAGPFSFLTKGKRNSELIAGLSLSALCVVGWQLWDHKHDAKAQAIAEREERKEDRIEIRDALRELTVSHREAVQVQRETACLLAQPQAQRDPEFCKRMSR